MVERHTPIGASYSVQVRVRGNHSVRLDGMTDLLNRAQGASVFDIGCNRGHVGYQFYLRGASKIHGCDIYEKGIETAREWFADFRDVEARFEVADLSKGPAALLPFGEQKYDFILLLATYHKLKRVMKPEQLSALMQHFGKWTKGYFAWRGTSDKQAENEDEMRQLDKDLEPVGLVRVHISYLSDELGMCAIWERK